MPPPRGELAYTAFPRAVSLHAVSTYARGPAVSRHEETRAPHTGGTSGCHLTTPQKKTLKVFPACSTGRCLCGTPGSGGAALVISEEVWDGCGCGKQRKKRQQDFRCEVI